MSEINNLLENEYIPYVCDYTIKQYDTIDYDKINYCDYHTFDYYKKRFKKSLPGLDQHILNIVEKNKNKFPLDEINNLDIKINTLNISNE